MLVWASTFPAITLGLKGIDAVPLAALRFAIAGGAMGLWLAVRGNLSVHRHDIGRVVVCGGLGIALYNILLNTGQKTVSPGAASFIIAIQPVFAALLARVSLNEAFEKQAWFGTTVSMVGAAIVALSQPGGLRFGGGAMLVLAAAACSGSYFVLQRPLVAKYGAFKCAALTLMTGGLLLAPWLTIGIGQAAAQFPSAAAAVYLAVGPGVFGYVCWMVTLDAFGAARSANFLYLMAPVATAISIPLLGELPSPQMIAGGAVAVAGVVIVNTAHRRVSTEIRRKTS